MWSPSEERESEMKCRDKSATRLSRCPEVFFEGKKLWNLQKNTQLGQFKSTLNSWPLRPSRRPVTRSSHYSWPFLDHMGTWVAIRDQGDAKDMLSSSPQNLTSTWLSTKEKITLLNHRGRHTWPLAYSFFSCSTGLSAPRLSHSDSQTSETELVRCQIAPWRHWTFKPIKAWHEEIWDISCLYGCKYISIKNLFLDPPL